MYRVIIADDKALIRAGLFYRNDWNAMGFEVAALLEDGSDVLEFLEKERADVLLADICMYSVSGLEAAKVIQEKYPWMKVVLISGYQEFEFAREAMQYKVYEYLLKPIDYGKLRQVFADIKKELDDVRYLKILGESFGEPEYDQVLQLLANLPELLEDGSKSWQDFANLKPVFQKAPSQMTKTAAEEMMKLLKAKLERRDVSLAQELDQKILDMGEDGASESLEEVLKWLEKELRSRDLLHPAAKKDACIEEACRYIRTHLGDDLSREKVAAHVHLSERHFTRRFVGQTGENFNAYTYRMRMEEAMRLLEEGMLSPEEVSERVGYRDFKYFQQLFKKYSGDTVRERMRRNSSDEKNDTDLT